MDFEEQPPGSSNSRASSDRSRRSLGESLRVVWICFGRDASLRRRQLAQEAERNPTGLGASSLAHDLWREENVAGAYRLAEKVLRANPTDFEMLLICLGYHVRARDSAQIYSFAKRLVAAKSTGHQMLRIYKALSVFLWPLELLGFVRRLRRRVNYSDRWVLWANNYLARHPVEIAMGGDPVGADHPPTEISARETAESEPRRKTWSATRIILLILLIAFLVYWAVLTARKSTRASASYAAKVLPVEPAVSRGDRFWVSNLVVSGPLGPIGEKAPPPGAAIRASRAWP